MKKEFLPQIFLFKAGKKTVFIATKGKECCKCEKEIFRTGYYAVGWMRGVKAVMEDHAVKRKKVGMFPISKSWYHVECYSDPRGDLIVPTLVTFVERVPQSAMPIIDQPPRLSEARGLVVTDVDNILSEMTVDNTKFAGRGAMIDPDFKKPELEGDGVHLLSEKEVGGFLEGLQSAKPCDSDGKLLEDKGIKRIEGEMSEKEK